MLKIFNKPALTRRQRFERAIIVGVAAAVLAIAINAFLIYEVGYILSVAYIAYGFGIGYAIQYFGKGVQVQFSLLAAGLTILVIIVGDLMAFGSFAGIIGVLSQFGSGSIWEIGYRIAGIVLAYLNARIVR